MDLKLKDLVKDCPTFNSVMVNLQKGNRNIAPIQIVPIEFLKNYEFISPAGAALNRDYSIIKAREARLFGKIRIGIHPHGSQSVYLYDGEL